MTYNNQLTISAGASEGLEIAKLALAQQQLVFIIVPDQLYANRLYLELKFFLAANALDIHIFPDWETLPYDQFSPHQDIISERLQLLSQLPRLKKGIIISSMPTLMNRIAPVSFIQQHSLLLSCGDTLNLTHISRQLQQYAYRHVEQVFEHGEFAIRGSIIDLYPMGSELPFRIELFDDEIDTIRSFDPDSQRSIEKLEKIALLPAKEFPLDDNAISQFRQQWRQQFHGNPTQCSIYQDISSGVSAAGVEYYLPLFFEDTASVIDYLPDDTLIIRFPELQNTAQQFWREVQSRAEQLGHDINRPILAPELAFHRVNETFAKINQHPQIDITLTSEKNLPDLNVDHKAQQPLYKLQQFLNDAKQHVLICAETAGRKEVLLEMLRSADLKPQAVKNWQAFLESDNSFAITVSALDQGMLTDDIIIITESNLFGERVSQRRRRGKSQQQAENTIKNLAELKSGDLIVHIDHGIGRYLGLKTITVGQQVDEYLELEYANQSKLYVPVLNLHLISRYSGADADNITPHTLGTDRWQKAKRKAQAKVRDVAAELLDVYARRAARQGLTFTLDKTQYQLFANEFPFEETIDQEKAIIDVLDDMQKSQPMDRLICGDVGFGKTEVAMRAAFVAVSNSKQVAVLAPTTLLAQQHYQSFCDRFANTPINIGVLSRFVTAKEQQLTLEKLKAGKVDIIIGTHKLLSKDVKFSDLGLLVIDEEHRFGVQQKEKVKAMRTEVDILTMTATPIPRTLNMAFANIRDLSIIATPPARRLAIKTFVQKRNDAIIREAILREILRGGQVYFLHNNIDTIEKTAREISELIPEARVITSHGQMRERELEQTMSDFYHRRFNVLVTTTIIETGIDIPSANTIIIDRADRFGLAQLHQLRGRVGRSHHQAYAYLLIPGPKLITKNAVKRLDAISTHEDLGVGFMLATHDLEIRGAGELLGEEQSGHIQAIGFNLYMEMLTRAVKSLQSGETINLDSDADHSEIDLGISAIIPDDFLADVQLRLIFYKKISNAKNNDELQAIQVEMVDRFGLLPEPTKNLFALHKLRQQLSDLGIYKLNRQQDYVRLYFKKNTKVNPEKLIELSLQNRERYRFFGADCFGVKIEKNEHQLANIDQELANI